MAHRQEQHIAQDRRGVVAIEFAVAAPLLVLLLTATVEIGFAARAYFMAADAASNGATYAALNGWDTTKINAAMVASSTRMAISTDLTKAPYCGCPGATGIAVTACGSSCSDGLLARRYADVTAFVTRVSIFPQATTLPNRVSAAATAQLQ